MKMLLPSKRAAGSQRAALTLRSGPSTSKLRPWNMLYDSKREPHTKWLVLKNLFDLPQWTKLDTRELHDVCPKCPLVEGLLPFAGLDELDLLDP
jgi:hypothetical protein